MSSIFLVCLIIHGMSSFVCIHKYAIQVRETCLNVCISVQGAKKDWIIFFNFNYPHHPIVWIHDHINQYHHYWGVEEKIRERGEMGDVWWSNGCRWLGRVKEQEVGRDGVSLLLRQTSGGWRKRLREEGEEGKMKGNWKWNLRALGGKWCRGKYWIR